jgi:rRNA N6-adenosine-methyltransferase METTL5
MKLRQLESLLQDVAPFEKPRIELEQYPTPSHLAACVMHTACGLGDIEGRAVVDLGCGGGMLSIAAVLLGAAHVVRSLPGLSWLLLTR